MRIHIEENDSTTKYFILNFRFYMFDESPNLEIKEQPSDTVREREKRHLAFTSFYIVLSSLCSEGHVVSKHCRGCQTYFFMSDLLA